MAGIVGKVQYVLECGIGCNSEQFLFSPCRSLSSGIKSPSDQSGTERGFRHKEQFSCRAIPARARAHGHACTQTSNHINLDFFHHAYTLSLSISPRFTSLHHYVLLHSTFFPSLPLLWLTHRLFFPFWFDRHPSDPKTVSCDGCKRKSMVKRCQRYPP